MSNPSAEFADAVLLEVLTSRGVGTEIVPRAIRRSRHRLAAS